jgi:transposase
MTNRTFKTGVSRDQPCLLPPRVEDYVADDNPVRVIEALVAALDLSKLGFRHAGSSGGAGQPPYDPADLLKLYLYGYLNRIRSSRSLEREAGRNLELIWLMKHLVPGYRTIAKFRQENWKALKALKRADVILCDDLVDEQSAPIQRFAGTLCRPKNHRRHFPLHDAALSCLERWARTMPASIVGFGIECGKDHAGEAEAAEIADPHRIELADQVITFVLPHARMEAVGLALDPLALRVVRVVRGQGALGRPGRIGRVHRLAF